MAVTVLDSSNLVEAVTTGVIPVPPGVAEDNAAQAAKRDGAKPAGEQKPSGTDNGAAPKAATATTEGAKEPKTEGTEADDVEGEDGLTPRQKREFTKSMLATIAKKHRAQRQAEELATNEYNRGRLAEEQTERLRRENESLKRQLNPAAAASAPDADAPPKRTDFENDAAYQDALIDYRVDQRLKAQQAEETKKREEQQQQELVQHAAARIERAIELVPDFREVTEAVDMEVPPHIAGYMQDSEMFAELGYFFAKNTDALEKLSAHTAGLKPGTPQFVKGITRSLVELGKIESRLSPFAASAKVNASPNGEEPSRTNGVKPSTETGSAPSKPRNQAPIIRPLNAGSAGQVGKDEKDMKPSEVINHWEQRHGTRLTARKRH